MSILDQMAKQEAEMDRATGGALAAGRPSQPTLTQTLEEKKSRLERELAANNEALEALKANPEVERVLNLVMKAARY